MSLINNNLKAVWVLENAKKDRNFYLQEIELLYLMASVIQWKRFNPDVPTHLICTAEVYQRFCELDIVYLWDHVDIEILKESDQIDRGPFWACSKIKAMRKISAPFVMMDNDLFLPKGNVITVEEFQNMDVIISHREHGPGYYLNSDHPTIVGLDGLYPPDYNGDSFNVSFLYIKDDDFRKRYCERAYQWMHELSLREGVHGGHMIFCEQKLLFDMVKDENRPHKAIIPDLYDCKNSRFFTESDVQSYVNHLGPMKRWVEKDTSLFLKKRSEVLVTLKDYHNIKHLFIALKRSESAKEEHSGKFYLSSQLNPFIEPSPLSHQNQPANRFCVVYSLWEEAKYMPYLKYSLISLISSTDVRACADIMIFVSPNLYDAAVYFFKGLLSEDSFVLVREIKAIKYSIPTHPRLKKYDYFMMVDSDAFFTGRSIVFRNIQDFYSKEENRKKLFMMKANALSSHVFWTRKKDLCKSLTDSEYENLFRERIGSENFDEMMKNLWWISCVVIYTKEHFTEEEYSAFALEQMWHNQMCDETVFISWSQKKNYSIESTDRFFKCYDVYVRKPDALALFHPIVGGNTTSTTNKELIEDIERDYDRLIKEYARRSKTFPENRI